MTSLQPTRHHIPSLWVLVDAQIVNIIMNNGFYYILICNIIPFREDQEMVDSRLRFPYITPLSPKWKFGENEKKLCFTQNWIYIVAISRLKVESDPHKNCNIQVI